MPGARFLAGEAVDLHTIEAEDVPFLQAHINDPRVRRHLTVRTPKNELQEETWFEEQVSDGDDVNLLVVGADGPAGTVRVGPIDDPDGRMEIGLWIREADWGRGYGTEASQLLVEYAFAELRAHRIAARVFEGNEASARVWEKLGFRHEATHREAAFRHGEYVDVHWYAVLEDEWNSEGSSA
jgi:RimJ/RimL family protein N-acetyltransferase